MSEKLNLKNENYNSEPNNERAEHKQAPPDSKPEKINHRHEHQERLTNIREEIGEKSKTSEELSKKHHNKDDAPKDTYKHVQAGSQMQTQALSQNLKKIQKHLPTYQRQFSKFIHKPVVEKVSEGIGSTVARPSGLLFAGIFSFVASLVVMTIARYYGYEYNYLIGLASLAGGFVIGLLIEAIYKLIQKTRAAS